MPLEDSPERIREFRQACRQARAAHVEFVELGVPRVNGLLVGSDRALAYLLDALLPEVREPVGRWCPGQQLLLPPTVSIRTLLVRDVDAMPVADQRRLHEWLHEASSMTQVVSTASASLLPLVECGAFIEALYYRLNVVVIDLAAAYMSPARSHHAAAIDERDEQEQESKHQKDMHGCADVIDPEYSE